MSATRIKHKDTFEAHEPVKFDNMFGELEFYKKRCEVLEKDLIKSQNTIKKMDVSLKKLQEINTINAKVTLFFKQSLNNTSIPFFLTSEFKNNWENFAKDQIMEAFENTFDNYFWLAHIVQDTVLIIYQETNSVIFQKISSILKVLNIEEKHPEKFLSRFRTFFQEYFFSIFTFTDEIMNRIKTKLYEVILKYKNFEVKNKEDTKKDIESKSFRTVAQMIFKLCIYMLLHEPQLTLNIQSYEKREFSYNFYSKTDYLNIEGFGSDLSSCITILAPPMIRNYLPFQGIKPSVYIIPQPDEEIIKCCEKNKAAKKTQQVEKTEYNPNINNNNEKIDKSSSPIKTEKKIKDINNELEPQNNLNNFGLNPSLEKQSNSKTNKACPFNSKDQSFPPHNTVKDKIPTNYMKFNKNIGKDIIISEIVNEVTTTVNQCYNHPLSLNKKKLVTEKYDLEENNLKNNYRLISQQIKTSSKNSSKSCSLNTSLKNDPLKLSEFNEAAENIIKTAQRQNSSRTNLNTIDQPLYKDSLNANKNLLNNGTNNISLSRKKNMVSIKQNSIPIDGSGKNEMNVNDNITKEFDDSGKNSHPINTQHLFEKQNTYSEYSSRVVPNDKNYFITTNQPFIRKKTSITPENELKQIVKEGENMLKKSVETNSASNLMKKIKNPLDGPTDKRRPDINSNSGNNKVANADNNKVFSSTVAQKKPLNLGLKMNKHTKSELHYEGPHTNRYDFPESHQDYFYNNNDTKFNAPKNFINNYENSEVNERNKSSNKLVNHTNSFKNNYETTNEKYMQNNNGVNTNMNMIQNNTKLESYTKKFGQILHKGEKKY